MTQSLGSSKLAAINYRNGVYQGFFDEQRKARHGFGLVYTTDANSFMASHWRNDEANGPTFIFHHHSKYIYGYWHNNLPHGFNAIRMGTTLILGIYQYGVIRSNLLVIFEQYNLATILEPQESEGGGSQFKEINKREIYSDEDFDEFVEECEWGQFQENWKTLIKFISANLTFNESERKEERVKLRLINGVHYRYGFDEGIAIVFDDDYYMVSAGLHKKAKLSSLGIRFLQNKQIEEGDFSRHNKQTFNFHSKSKPNDKIGRIYSNYLLRGIDFINRFLSNPAKLIIEYFQDLSHSQLFKIIVSGQIMTRKIELSMSSPGTKRSQRTGESPERRFDKNVGKLIVRQLTPERGSEQKKVSFEARDSRNSKTQKEVSGYFHQNKPKNRNDAEDQDMEEEKDRLEKYKKELALSLSRKVMKDHEEQIKNIHDAKKSSPIINKKPVQIFPKKAHPVHEHPIERSRSRSRSRSPIFTPDHSPNRSSSPYTVSPFSEKMKFKIFKEKTNQIPKKYVYEPIEPQRIQSHSRPYENLNNYQSPHEALEISREQRNEQNNEEVLPFTMKSRKNNSQYMQRNSKQEIKIEPKPIRKTVTFGDQGTSFIKAGEQGYKEEKNSNNRNQVYLKPTRDQNRSPMRPKGNSYLERYQLARNMSPVLKEEEYESKKYERTIRGFNESNRPYELVTSPKVEDLPRKGRGSPTRRPYKYVFDEI